MSLTRAYYLTSVSPINSDKTNSEKKALPHYSARSSGPFFLSLNPAQF